MRDITFAVGPVEMGERTLKVGGQQPPYFRTAAFSQQMQRAETDFLALVGAPEGSRAVFLSCSGTGGMEAAVSGLLTTSDRALVIEGGSFGKRFSELCAFHGIPYEPVTLAPGEPLTKERLALAEGGRFSALLVNLCETSTGVLYDLDLLHRFCDRHGLFLIVDAVSALIADELDMHACGADAVITASQKALAAAPGIAPLALAPRALERVRRIAPKSYYLDLRHALSDGERGQTPFTPSLSVLLQLFERLEALQNGGMQQERAAMHALAEDFRARIAAYPLAVATTALSNAVTPVRPTNGASAYAIFETLMRDYGISVCPNGGELRDTLFRVGHMGALAKADNDLLFQALSDMQRRALL
ncbi:MAG: alanine--glyoxylate aminotransferase family protein [Clostridia bacterium]|nr:alanine--glyoxylate aminotransferase family protein [Clostridia bacterium]